MNLSGCDVVILAGGRGTRIRDMLPQGQPKACADINGRPFIRILLSHLRRAGFEKFTICCGYGQEQIINFVASNELAMFCCEHEQYGTGGALRIMMRSPAVNLSDPFFLINGDTITEGFDYARALACHSDYDGITAFRYNFKNNGIFVVSTKIRAALEWEPRESFNLEELPLHTISRIVDIPSPYLDIGTPEGLAEARARFR